MDKAVSIGWVGLGNMGSRLAPRLASAGHRIMAFDLDPSRLATLGPSGVLNAGSLSALASESAILFSMLPHDAAFFEVARVISDHSEAGTCLIDMSTISPKTSAKVASLLSEKGIQFLRAPVSGSTGLAERGELSILVSGPRDAFDANRHLLDVLGTKISYLGVAEEARVAKLVINTMVAATNNALAEALNLGRRGGLDWQDMIDVISNSAISSPYIVSKATKLKQRDWSAAAPVSLIAKDVDLALDFGRQQGAFMPITAIVQQILTTLEGQGKGALDMSAVVTFYD